MTLNLKVLKRFCRREEETLNFLEEKKGLLVMIILKMKSRKELEGSKDRSRRST